MKASGWGPQAGVWVPTEAAGINAGTSETELAAQVFLSVGVDHEMFEPSAPLLECAGSLVASVPVTSLCKEGQAGTSELS